MSNLNALPVVLVLSGDITKAAFLKKVLKDECHLLEYQKAKEALSAAKTTILDIVIVDSILSDLEPIQFCREIRKIAAYFETPIILITHNLKKTHIEAAKAAGVTGFLHEPLEKKEVEERIVAALRIKTIERNLATSGHFAKLRKASLSQHKVVDEKTMKEIQQARKLGGRLSLLMIEIDGLEKMEDKIAQEATDLLTATFRQQIRTLDVLIIHGTGKFILLLPKTSQRAAEVIAETLRAEAKRAPFSRPLTISAGLVSFDSSLEPNDNLIETTSIALMEAKRKGNCVVTA